MNSKTAKRIKSQDTKIELLLAKAMWANGFRYRKNCKDIYGKPDFCFKGKKIAVFCDSEFWHGKKYLGGEKFKSNAAFWEKKIQRNIERDIKVNEKLKNENWTVLRFWGADICNNIDSCIKSIKENYEKNI